MDLLFNDPLKCQKCKDADVKLRLSTLYKETNGISIPLAIPQENFKALKRKPAEMQKAYKQRRVWLQKRYKIYEPLAVKELEERLEYVTDPLDFVQCEAGSHHCLLLNSLGQVYAFGSGL